MKYGLTNDTSSSTSKTALLAKLNASMANAPNDIAAIMNKVTSIPQNVLQLWGYGDLAIIKFSMGAY